MPEVTPRPKANSAWDWLKRWGLWILLGLGVVLAAFCWLLPTSKKGRPEILQKAKDGARELKDEQRVVLQKHEHAMAAREKELETIEEIDDERERLEALAAFANRRK